MQLNRKKLGSLYALFTLYERAHNNWGMFYNPVTVDISSSQDSLFTAVQTIPQGKYYTAALKR
jgi:hypothetical protein